jgi:hypothetical protein
MTSNFLKNKSLQQKYKSKHSICEISLQKVFENVEYIVDEQGKALWIVNLKEIHFGEFLIVERKSASVQAVH